MNRVQILLLLALLIVITACSNVLITSNTENDTVQSETIQEEYRLDLSQNLRYTLPK